MGSKQSWQGEPNFKAKLWNCVYDVFKSTISDHLRREGVNGNKVVSLIQDTYHVKLSTTKIYQMFPKAQTSSGQYTEGAVPLPYLADPVRTGDGAPLPSWHNETLHAEQANAAYTEEARNLVPGTHVPPAHFQSPVPNHTPEHNFDTIFQEMGHLRLTTENLQRETMMQRSELVQLRRNVCELGQVLEEQTRKRGNLETELEQLRKETKSMDSRLYEQESKWPSWDWDFAPGTGAKRGRSLAGPYDASCPGTREGSMHSLSRLVSSPHASMLGLSTDDLPRMFGSMSQGGSEFNIS